MRFVLLQIGVLSLTLTGCMGTIFMPPYQSTVDDRPESNYSYVLESVTVQNTLYESEAVALDGEQQFLLKPKPEEWLEEAIEAEFEMAGLIRGSTGPKVKVVVEQFFAEEVTNWPLFFVTIDQASILRLKISVLSNDGITQYDRRFIGHFEDINQIRWIYPIFLMNRNQELSDILVMATRKALTDAATGTRELFDEGLVQ